jgi:hypothetical protein
LNITWKPIEEKTMRNASAKRNLKSNPFTNNPQVQTEDVPYNPINPVNPDSKPGKASEY